MNIHSRPTLTTREFIEAWNDQETTVAEIARRANRAPVNVWFRAKRLGLPPRKMGPAARCETPLFREMYLAGVSLAEMAGHFEVSTACVINTARRLGLPRRENGKPAKTTLLAFLMARVARQEQERFRTAEMLDARTARGWGRNG